MELVYSRKLELSEAADCKYRELDLNYYLVSCKSEDSCTYGLQINMTKDGGEMETILINDVLPSRTKMIELIKLMYNNSVTPVSALDVIYDCIA